MVYLVRRAAPLAALSVVGLLLGAAYTVAHAELEGIALNGQSPNGLQQNDIALPSAATQSGATRSGSVSVENSALEELNGVAVDAVILPPGEAR